MSTRFSQSDLRSVLDAWTTAGLDPEPIEGTLLAAQQRISELSRELNAHKAGSDRPTIVAALAHGELTLLAAARSETDAMEGRPSDATRINELHNHAVTVVLSDARRALIAQRDTLLTEHLAPAVAANIADITERAPVVAGIDGHEAAMAGGPEVRTAWSELCELQTRHAAILTAVATLARVEILEAFPRNLYPEYRTLEYPERAPRAWRGHLVRQLITLIDSGASPGVYSAAEAASHAERDRREADAAAAEARKAAR